MRYPLFLNLQDQPVVVVGAGQVAARKIRSLLAAGAQVTVISPDARRLPPQVRWRKRRYRSGDLRGAVVVVAATDDFAVNRRVCAEAKRRRQLVNCITEPAAGNFIVPAVAGYRGVRLAISTGGAAPALAKKLRQELERWLRRRYAARHD
jgi:precorrin-2 dehydrogenase/sirohydrochlorin ferrochelatase